MLLQSAHFCAAQRYPASGRARRAARRQQRRARRVCTAASTPTAAEVARVTARGCPAMRGVRLDGGPGTQPEAKEEPFAKKEVGLWLRAALCEQSLQAQEAPRAGLQGWLVQPAHDLLLCQQGKQLVAARPHQTGLLPDHTGDADELQPGWRPIRALLGRLRAPLPGTYTPEAPDVCPAAMACPSPTCQRRSS